MIFVFGSNLAGRHGKGAALTTMREYGAVYGEGVGRTGNAYAIPTKDGRLHRLMLDEVEFYVNEFIDYVRRNPSLEFQVTKIGCGLAKFKEADIKPLFSDAPSNCFLPLDWRN